MNASRVIGLSMLVLPLVAASGAGRGAAEKSIIVTVLDKSGTPVHDVQPADLAVQEDGATREVTAVRPAVDPMVIALLADNTSPTMGKNAPTQELRKALTAFVTTIQGASPDTQISLWQFAGQGVMTVKPTVKTDDLLKTIKRMFPDKQTGGVLLEALVDASKEISKKMQGPRRVIVSVSFNSPEVSAVEPSSVAETMHKAGVSYWAVSIQSNADASTSSQGSTASREVILDRVTAASGGMRITGVDPSALESQVKSVADALLSQYVVTYASPDGAPAPGRITAVSRKGAKVLTSPWVQ